MPQQVHFIYITNDKVIGSLQFLLVSNRSVMTAHALVPCAHVLYRYAFTCLTRSLRYDVKFLLQGCGNI